MSQQRSLVMMGIGGILALSASLPVAWGAPTQVKPPECYKFKSFDSPAASPEVSEQEEIWCYRELDKPQGARIVYNIDEQGHTRPELTIMIEADGSIVHGSILAGHFSVHRIPGYRGVISFNPLPVPLTPPKDAERFAPPITPSSLQSMDTAIEVLTTYPIRTQETGAITEGTFNVSVAEEALPWKAFWFPYSSGKLHNGSDSPMAKFDRFVKARTGVNIGAQKWEKRNHRYTGVKWAGHCNGWAAASVLRREPRMPWTDPISGVTFTPNDIKGLLIARDYCPKMLFFGHRNWGAGSGAGDIQAHLFHNTLTYYIGQLGKPVLMDMMSTSPVENRVLSGYKMKVVRQKTNLYMVTMELRVHSYDTKFTDDLGPAPYKDRTYRYKIWTDDTGKAIKGSWLTSNPDFLWVPVSPGSCKDGNPAVTETWVDAIYKSLSLPWK